MADKPMTVDQAIEKKAQLEELIFGMLQEFSKETKVVVSEIRIHQVKTSSILEQPMLIESRSFYTKERPINHPDDLRGLKIRVMPSPSAVNMVRAMGGSPTPISWGELYTALQGGVVDGAENNPPSFYLSNHFEVCRYYSLNEHSTIPDVLLMSTKIWNTLSEEEQRWLQEAATESAEYQRKLWAESEQYSLEQAKAAGVQIIYPDKGPFIEKVQFLYDEFKNDPQLYDFIKRIQAKE